MLNKIKITDGDLFIPERCDQLVCEVLVWLDSLHKVWVLACFHKNRQHPNVLFLDNRSLLLAILCSKRMWVPNPCIYRCINGISILIRGLWIIRIILVGLLAARFPQSPSGSDLQLNFLQLLIVRQEWLLIESERLNEGVPPVLLTPLFVGNLHLPEVFELFLIQVRLILHLVAAQIINFQLFN